MRLHCNTLQHTATHCTPSQHTATHCNTLQHAATHCNILQHTATHCNTLYHTATHYNRLQQSATEHSIGNEAQNGYQNRKCKSSRSLFKPNIWNVTYSNHFGFKFPFRQLLRVFSSSSKEVIHTYICTRTYSHTHAQTQHIQTLCVHGMYNTQHHTRSYCNSLYRTATRCITLQHNTATYTITHA